MRLPTVLYAVRIVPGGKGSLGYSEKGGGTYTMLSHAEDKVRMLNAKGINSKIFKTETLWEEM